MYMHFSHPNTTIAGFTLFIMIFLWNCTDLGSNPDDNDITDVISFTGDIQPIFNQNCANNCHLNNTSGGLNLSSYTGLMSGGKNGVVVIPGNGTDSIIIQKLGSNPPFGDQMPIGSSALSSTKIKLITTWIDDGAEDN